MNKSFNLLLKVFLLCSPIVFLPLSVPAIASLQFYQFGYFGTSIGLIQFQIFCFSVVLLFTFSMFSKEKRILQDKYIGWLLLISLASVYFHPKTLKFFPSILFGFLLYYLVSVYAKVRNLRPFFYVIAFVSIINTVFALCQSFGFYPILSPKNEIIGLMGYKTQLGIYQALAMPICYALNPCLSIVPAIGLLLSKSGTALIPAIIGMAYLLRKDLLKIQSPILWLSFFTAFAVFIIKNFHQLSIRIPAWIEAITQGINHIFIGNGIGIFSLTLEKESQKLFYSDPYSLYLQVFHALGIFGFMALILFILDKFRNVPDGKLNDALKVSCLIVAISGIGYSFLDYPRLAGTAIVLFGLLTALKGENKSCV